MSEREDGSGVLVRVSTEAPFRQIVGQIRAQIDGGQLRPGDRVPSARQITAEWGVAIATATKVLAALRAEGLVEAVRGVGTVVADRDEPTEPVRRERRPRQPPPSRPASRWCAMRWRSPTPKAWRRCPCAAWPPISGWPP